MIVLFVPMFFAGLILLSKNPDLLKKRLNAKETQDEQSLVIKLSGLMFLTGFVLAGLSFRFSLLQFPRWLSFVGVAVFLIAYGLYAEVLRENIYLSRTIEIQAEQTVVDTGLYGIVRHPMYAITVLLFLSMPLILGALLSFLIFLPYPAILVRRIRNEEAILENGLPGYQEYKKKVQYRMIPFIW